MNAPEELQDIAEFVSRIKEEHTIWLASTPPEKRDRAALYIDGQSYTPKQIVDELNAHSPVAIKYIRMIYDLHFAPVAQPRPGPRPC